MLGHPKYNYGDQVKFTINFESGPVELIGKIEIIDRYGTFEQNDHVSYDVMVDDFNGAKCLVKHIIEPNLELA